MAVRGFQHLVRDVQSSGPADECQEEVHNGMPYLLGSRHPVGGGRRLADDGRRDIIRVEAYIQDSVFRVWGVNGDGV